MKEIKLFRTISGQDYIASLVETTDTVYKVEKLLLLVVQTSANNMQVGFAPVSHPLIGYFDRQVNDEPPNVELNRGCILFVYNPSEDIAKNYSQATGTIQIATSIR